MKTKISIGSWAYCFGPYKDNPVDIRTVVHKLKELGLDGVELGGFDPHPSPDKCYTQAQRRELKSLVKDNGLEFSGLAANLWMHKVISNTDSGPMVAEFAKNLFYAEDLGIDMIRVDTMEQPDVFEKTGTDPKLGMDRIVAAWDLCAKLAANRGVRVAWEFEPGFAFNKPSEIVEIVDRVRGLGNDNFGVMYDTCHAHMVAANGSMQVGAKETLPGGAIELLHKLSGMITHIHLIDSDNTINEHATSTHAPFGQGVLNFDELIPALVAAKVPSEWWCIDLCFWPDAWNVTQQSMEFLNPLRAKYAA